jgi:hypothetical protein
METVRDMVRAARKEIREQELQPDRMAHLVAHLSALFGNCADEVRRTELLFNDTVRGYINEGHAVNKSEVLAKTTPQYAAWREAKDTLKETEQMISALKAALRMKAEEMRLG